MKTIRTKVYKFNELNEALEYIDNKLLGYFGKEDYLLGDFSHWQMKIKTAINNAKNNQP